MDARLIQTALAQRAAAAHTVAGALAPRATSAAGKSAASAATATTTGTATTSATDPNSTITSSDFLTLLVSELKNQDPTQPTDPNAYITQLVGVNSLEQLISINSGISTLDTSVPATGTTTGSTTGSSVPAITNTANLQPATAIAASQIHKQVQGATAQ